MILSLLFALVILGPAQFNEDMEKQPLTALSPKMDQWEFELGNKKGHFETSKSNDWSSWNYDYAGQNGVIKKGKKSWNEWLVDDGVILIKAYHGGEYDFWELKGDCDLRIRTQFNDGYSEWEITGDAQLYASPGDGDWDQWYFQGILPDMSNAEIVGMAFTFVFVSLAQSGAL
jgi:hypothetical protein